MSLLCRAITYKGGGGVDIVGIKNLRLWLGICIF